jgi:DNA sulfur modification protein DndC
MSKAQTTMFDDGRLSVADSLDLTAQSLIAYGSNHRHWAMAYSGGKDSSALVTAVLYLIAQGRVPAPKSLTVLYADTRQELPPLHAGALAMLEAIEQSGLAQTRVVLPEIPNRFMVYMLGRGVPPPNNNTLRWCTPKIKVEPMTNALKALRDEHGEKFLMLTGVRIGESAARDQRIALSCGKNGAECGQGWFQETIPSAVADTLAPILHWRVCNVWDWLTAEKIHGLPTKLVALVYGGDQATEINARTGCVGCPLATSDLALDNLLSMPQFAHLAPLKELRPLYTEMRSFKHRKQKREERLQGGELSANPNRKGPLTPEARAIFLDRILDIQRRARVDLINAEEEAAIRQMIADRVYPQRWSDADPDATELIPQVGAFGTQIVLPELGAWSRL